MTSTYLLVSIISTRMARKKADRGVREDRSLHVASQEERMVPCAVLCELRSEGQGPSGPI
jgi:hypothetical protein